jgi:hypothetical protein
MITQEELATHIRGLETQLMVLKAQIKQLEPSGPSLKFADLYGLLAGKANSSEEAIAAALYRVPWEEMEEAQG